MVLSIQPSADSWMNPIIRHLKDGNLPADPEEASKLRHRSARFCLIGDRLYKRGFSTPFLKCLTPEDGARIIQEIHEGPSGAHQGARVTYQKILRLGYFWPTLQKDTLDFVRKCDTCQRHNNIIHAPATTLASISGPWPFAQWGLDIVGPLPTAPGQRKYLIVAIDYFTKWIEAEPLASITEKACWNFLWRNIICRFGVPRTIISDNGLQFTGKLFAEECTTLGIEHRFSSVYFPQANGQVEVSNRTLLDGLKKRLETTAGNWPNILPNVLWSYRTTPRRATGETPFCMTYGAEAVIPTELTEATPRIAYFQEGDNSRKLDANLDILDEVREAAALRSFSYQRQASAYHQKKVKSRTFRVGDLVLRKRDPGGSLSCPRCHKLKQGVGGVDASTSTSKAWAGRKRKRIQKLAHDLSRQRLGREGPRHGPA